MPCSKHKAMKATSECQWQEKQLQQESSLEPAQGEILDATEDQRHGKGKLGK